MARHLIARIGHNEEIPPSIRRAAIARLSQDYERLVYAHQYRGGEVE
jgi:hypothetical protein